MQPGRRQDRTLTGMDSFKWSWMYISVLMLVPSALLKNVPLMAQAACTVEEQASALQEIYNSAGGPYWTRTMGWNNQTINCTKLLTYGNRTPNRTVSLPSHCCWEGVSCCLSTSDTGANECSQYQYQCDCVVGHVTGLTLVQSNLTGSLTSIFNQAVIDNLECSLRMVLVGGNSLTGTIPPRLNQLTHLSVFSVGTGNCTEEEQVSALLEFYDSAGGPNWNRNRNWNNQTMPCTDTLTYNNGTPSEVVQLPSYCCWEGVSCCLSARDTGANECSQYQCDCNVKQVTGFSLGQNNLTGNLTSIFSHSVIDNLRCSLQMVFMGGNSLTGTILPRLNQLYNLGVLSLGSNNLSGTIPAAINSLQKLQELDVGSNLLTGSVPSMLCGGPQRVSQLRDLILSNNQLNGTLNITDCENLIYLDAQNNNFTGELPSLRGYRQLHILRLGYNFFSGLVTYDSFDLRLLVLLDLAENYLTGNLPAVLTNSTSQLTIVRLYGNQFTGNIPSGLFNVGTLTSVLLNNNLLTGSLPVNIGQPRGLLTLRLFNNSLTGTLPSSLETLARGNGELDVSRTNMSCCGYDFVAGKGYRHFNEALPRLPSFLSLSTDMVKPVLDNDPSSNYYGLRCPFLMLNNGDGTQTVLYSFNLDPEYYQYEDCYCLSGFKEKWTYPVDGEPSMGPRLECKEINQPWYQKYPWAVVLIVLGGLLIAAWLTWLMCFRRGKNAAIVQSCLNIRKRIQGEPNGGQVSIVVTDIEGYSDLMKQSPELMTRALNIHNAIIRKSRWSNFGYTLEQEGDSYALVFYEAHDAVVFCLQTQLALNRQAWPEGLFTADMKEMSKRRVPAPSILNAISLMTNNLTASLFGGRTSIAGQHGSDDRSMTLAAPASSMRTNNMSGAGEAAAMRPDSRQSSTAAPPGGREFSTLATPSAVGGGINKGHPVLFNGMRVRMGIATGTLPPGTSAKGSAVMDMAKVVSDAANGGQIMLCERSFKNVKERMEEFSAVDHNGMNFKKLNSIKPPWYSCAKKKHLRNPDDALLLDMGEYTYCPGCKRLPLFQLEATPVAETPGAAGPPTTPKGSGRRGKSSEPMRLYQLIPPALMGRAKVWGNKVTVKDDWFCSDSPYFDAPGTLEAPLGLIEGPVLLPPITMAFLIAENGKIFAARYRRDARRVNDVVAACIKACLRCVRGGYLCRMQDGDLKYMVAFSCPQAAVEWALLLQDVLMYADWPEAACKFWKEEYDERGRMIFRGPRMKVGLCEGSPRSIIPDHIGRADYHGASINQAARYMDAAAHGGMIALEASLAIKVIELWRSGESTVSPGTADSLAGAMSYPPEAAAAAAELPSSASAAALDWSMRGSDPPADSGSGVLGGAAPRARMAAVREVEGVEEPQAEGAAAGAGATMAAASFRTATPFATAQRAAAAAAPGDEGASSAPPPPAVASGGSAAGGGSGSGSRSGKSESLTTRWSLKRIWQQNGGLGSKTARGESGHGPGHLRPQSRILGGSSQVPGTASSAPAPAPALALAPATGHGLVPQGSRGGSRRSSVDGELVDQVDELPTFRQMVGSTSEAAGGMLCGEGPGGGGFGQRLPPVPASTDSDYCAEATLRGNLMAGLREQQQQPPEAAGITLAAAGVAAAAGVNGPSDTRGPVAEGDEGAGSGGDAAAVNGTDTTARAVPAASGLGGSSGPALSGGGGSGDGGRAAVRRVEELTAGSGPSMTSLAGSDQGVGRTSPMSSLPTPLHPFGSDEQEGVAAADAAASGGSGSGAEVDMEAGDGGGAAATAAGKRRPSPLAPVPSPIVSADDSIEAITTAPAADGPTPAVAGAGATTQSVVLGSQEPVSTGGGLASTSAVTRSSAPQLQSLDIPGGSAADGGGGEAQRPGGLGAMPMSSGFGAGGRPPSAFRNPVTRRQSGPGPLRTHVSFASNNASSTGGGPSSAGPSSAGQGPGLPPASRAYSSAAHVPPPSIGSGVSNASGAMAGGAVPYIRKTVSAIQPGAAATAAAAMAGGGPTGSLSPATSTVIRSPRPPSLPPLSLPSEKERDEALRADRAAAEAARKVQVDGPADARYNVRVAAYRIGVFRFKGSPEPIQMAHIILEHLSGRRFPADPPKGKGNKVGEAFGLVDECETSLPDLASIMRDRYMLSRPHFNPGAGLQEDSRSSPSGRRLRMLMGSQSLAHGPGHQSPSSPSRVLPKSRSVGPRMHGAGSGGGGGGGGSVGGGPSGSDGGGSGNSPLAAGAGSGGGGNPRRASNLMLQMVQSFATASLRRVAKDAPKELEVGERRSGSPAARADRSTTEPGEGGPSDQFGSWSGVVAVGLSPAVDMATGVSGAGRPATSGNPPQAELLSAGSGGEAAAGGGGASLPYGRPPPRMSPLRFASTRDGGPPVSERPASGSGLSAAGTSATAAAASSSSASNPVLGVPAVHLGYGCEDNGASAGVGGRGASEAAAGGAADMQGDERV